MKKPTLIEQLRAMGLVNTWDLLSLFGGNKDVAVQYHGRETWQTPGTSVWAVDFKTNPSAAWYDYGNKVFHGNRAESFPKAPQWASETYGITEWATCSLSGGRIPKRVLKRAKAAVKAQGAYK